jgi:hypothetical protein
MKEFLFELDKEYSSSSFGIKSVDQKYQGTVCLDFGPKNIAISTATHSFERDICQGLVPKTKTIRLLQRAMDRSRRA